MPTRIYTRMQMCSWWEIFLQEEVHRYRLNGRGNGGLQSQQRIEEGVGGTTAASVILLLSFSRMIAKDSKFVEYDQRAHRLNTLASFSFWVSSKFPLYAVFGPSC
jgi:hypothetical protein